MWMSLKILKYILGGILEIAPSSLSSLLSDTPFIQSLSQIDTKYCPLPYIESPPK